MGGDGEREIRREVKWDVVIPVLAVFAGIMAVAGAIIWAIIEFAVPWVLDALAVEWVPITGGYFVVEQSSPLYPWVGGPFVYVLAILLTLPGLYILALFLDDEPYAVGSPFVRFVEVESEDEVRGGSK